MHAADAANPSQEQPSHGRPSRRRRLARWALGLAGAMLLLVAGYLAGMHWLLNGDWLARRLSQAPGVTVSWSAASSQVPGRLSVRDLRLERQDGARSLGLAVDAAELELSLWALFSRRLEIRRLEAQGLRSLRVGEYRLAGRGELRLSGLSLEAARLRVDHLRLALDDAVVRRGGDTLARDIRLAADLDLDALRLDQALGVEALRLFSGELSLAAQADAWDVFNPYLRELDWLSLAGRGGLVGELRLERGVLAPGSELTLTSPSLRLTLDEGALRNARDPEASRARGEGGAARYRLAGAGGVTARVEAGKEAPAMRLAVALDDMTMHRAQLSRPFLTSRRFRLEASLPGADLADPPRAPTSAALVWDDARLPDVAVLARYLPTGVPFALHGGSSRLDGRLDYDGGAIEGDFALVGEAVSLTLLEQRVTGAWQLDLVLAGLDPVKRRLDLSGTRLRLEARGEGDAPPLTTDLTLQEARLALAPPAADGRDPGGAASLEGYLVLAGRVARLGFLDGFLAKALGGRGVRLEGDGELAATLRLRRGRLAPGSHLTVTTARLGARFLGLHAQGAGRVEARWPADEPARLAVSLEGAELRRGGDGRRLVQAERLELKAESEAADPVGAVDDIQLSLEWRGAEMADVAVLNAYLPEAAPVVLLGGRAVTRGRMSFEGPRGRGQAWLAGDAIRGRLFDETLEGELDLNLVVGELRLDGGRLDLSGTRLEMQAASRAADEAGRLRTVLIARQARFDDLWSATGAATEAASGRLVLEGRVANLGFLDAFLPEAHGVAVRGDGLLSAELMVSDATLQPGSRLWVSADRLKVRFLDHEASGTGRLEAAIEESAVAPGARLRVTLDRFALRRRDEAAPHVSGRHFTVETTLAEAELTAGRQTLEGQTTRLRLANAEVADLGVFNAYLPENAGIELLSGRAGLEADLRLEGLRAEGLVTLQAFDAGVRVGEQRLAGDLRLDARLADGDLDSGVFDASGSRLRFDHVSRQAAKGDDDAGWWVQLDLDRGRLTWTRPLQLDARLALAMRDSGLIARLLMADARERRWIGRLLSVPGIRGDARLRLSGDGWRLDEARLVGSDLEMLANLVLRDEALNGALYARFGALRLGVALEDGETRLRFWRPRRWYDEGDGEDDWVELSPEAAEALRSTPPLPEE